VKCGRDSNRNASLVGYYFTLKYIDSLLFIFFVNCRVYKRLSIDYVKTRFTKISIVLNGNVTSGDPAVDYGIKQWSERLNNVETA